MRSSTVLGKPITRLPASQVKAWFTGIRYTNEPMTSAGAPAGSGEEAEVELVVVAPRVADVVARRDHELGGAGRDLHHLEGVAGQQRGGRVGGHGVQDGGRVQLLHLHREGDGAALHLTPGDRGVRSWGRTVPEPQLPPRWRNITLMRGPALARFGTQCSNVRWHVPPCTSRSPACSGNAIGRPAAVGPQQERAGGAERDDGDDGVGAHAADAVAVPGHRVVAVAVEVGGDRRQGRRRSGGRGSAPCGRAAGGRSGHARVSSRGTSTTRSYIGRSNAFHGAVSSSSSKSVSAPVTQPGHDVDPRALPEEPAAGAVERRVEVRLAPARAATAAR